MSLIIPIFVFLVVFFYFIIVFNKLQNTLNNISHSKLDVIKFEKLNDVISQEKMVYAARVVSNLKQELSSMLKRSDFRLMLKFLRWHPEIKCLNNHKKEL